MSSEKFFFLYSPFLKKKAATKLCFTKTNKISNLKSAKHKVREKPSRNEILKQKTEKCSSQQQ